MKKLLTVLLCLGLAGCATGKYVTVEPSNKSYDFNVNKQKVFDAALLGAQELNLDVKVIEKDSGLIRFDKETLSPEQLDQYCAYPVVDSNGQPFGYKTFQNWNNNAIYFANAGPVAGKLSITILVTEHGTSSSVNVRTNMSAFNHMEEHPCKSKGVIEDEFISKLQSHLK